MHFKKQNTNIINYTNSFVYVFLVVLCYFFSIFYVQAQILDSNVSDIVPDEYVDIENSDIEEGSLVDEEQIPDNEIETEDIASLDELSIEENHQSENFPVDNYRREKLPSDMTYDDFVVGPGRFPIELSPGETVVVEIAISNRMGEGRYFSLATEDMSGSNDPDQTIVLLGEEVGPYSIRDFISISHDKFYLEHGYRARVPVTVSLPADAEPGGRYGSLLVSTITNPRDEGSTSQAQSGSVIIGRVATLFFVTTPGEIDTNSKLIDFSTRNNQKFFTKGPLRFDVVTENFGTVHTAPYGSITVRNIMGEQIWVGNIDPWFVMPQSLRTRSIEWEPEFLFGRYTATAEINRGYSDIIDVKTISFWVIPWKLVASVFFGLFLFFLLIRFFFSKFELKRKN